MTDNELSKLNRKDLLEMLLKLSEENQELREKLKTAESALADRQIKIDSAGSIAEAALALNGLFEATQAACRQYTDNIESLSRRQETICAQLERESREEATALLEDARKQKDTMLRDTETRCADMVSQAKTRSEAYWTDVSEKLEQFYAEHVGLRELLGVMTQRKTPEQEAKA